MFSLEVADPSSVIQLALQRAMDLVTYGLQISRDPNIHDIKLSEIPIRISPAHNLAMSLKEVHEEFPNWIIANGIRDCVDAIGPSLEWARKICFLWTCNGVVRILEDGRLNLSTTISGNKWNSHMIEDGQSFDRWSLRRKIDHLSKVYDFAIPKLSATILSINNARNCLTHRMGIVGKEDTKSEVTLIISWQRIKLAIEGKEGIREIHLPMMVSAGDVLSLEFIDVKKEYNIGEKLQFSMNDFIDIVMTFLNYSMQIKQSIFNIQNKRRPIN